MYMAMSQYKTKLVNDEITEREIWDMAYELADRKIQERIEILENKHADKADLAKQDQLYREEREEQYREDFDWSTKSDEKILENILTAEVNIRRQERILQDDSIGGKERNEALKNLMDLLKVHRDLLVSAGIDRVTREKRKQGSDPMEDWARVKELGAAKLKQLAAEFTEKMETVRTEAELRDRMKYHLGYPFDIIDAALRAHRRVLHLDTRIEVS